jgi:hypothetical protein
MSLRTIQQFLTLCAESPANHKLFVIARREANRRRRADRLGNPGKNPPQALLIYNAYLFFTWITKLLDSAYGMNRSARDDGKPNIYNIYEIQNKNCGIV